jgi:serine protease inhibitor
LFFSPYSLSSALTMTAEGARGQTAEEMGKVLGFPSETRSLGNDAQSIPWNTALIHTGMADLNKRFNSESPETKQLRDKIAALRKELDETNRQASQEKDVQKHDTLARKSQHLAGELNNLFTKVDQYEIRVANALWGEKTYPFRQSYLDTIHKFYNTGGIFSVDFQADFEAVRQQINAWVEQQTKDKIRDLIAPGVLTKDTRLVLTNAIYFKGEWAAKFEPGQTRDEDFLLADGTKKRVPMMHQDYNWSSAYAAFNADGTFFKTPEKYSPSKKDTPLYPAEGGFTMLEMPYKGGELSLVAILPQDAGSLKNLEQKLTSANLQAWIQKLQARTVHIALPKFRLEEEYPLNATLKAMGMVRAFLDPGLYQNGAQFDGMCADADPMHKLFLGAVLHKAFLDVSEKGTEAAAATYETMPAPASEARPPDDLEPFIPRFQADKPFVFLIRDKKSDSILFLGRVLRP